MLANSSSEALVSSSEAAWEVAPSATEWLADSGLELRDGVVCAPDLNVGVPLVYAAGDIVRWYNTLFEEEMRLMGDVHYYDLHAPILTSAGR